MSKIDLSDGEMEPETKSEISHADLVEMNTTNDIKYEWFDIVNDNDKFIGNGGTKGVMMNGMNMVNSMNIMSYNNMMDYDNIFGGTMGTMNMGYTMGDMNMGYAVPDFSLDGNGGSKFKKYVHPSSSVKGDDELKDVYLWTETKEYNVKLKRIAERTYMATGYQIVLDFKVLRFLHCNVISLIINSTGNDLINHCMQGEPYYIFCGETVIYEGKFIFSENLYPTTKDVCIPFSAISLHSLKIIINCKNNIISHLDSEIQIVQKSCNNQMLHSPNTNYCIKFGKVTIYDKTTNCENEVDNTLRIMSGMAGVKYSDIFDDNCLTEQSEHKFGKFGEYNSTSYFVDNETLLLWDGTASIRNLISDDIDVHVSNIKQIFKPNKKYPNHPGTLYCTVYCNADTITNISLVFKKHAEDDNNIDITSISTLFENIPFEKTENENEIIYKITKYTNDVHYNGILTQNHEFTLALHYTNDIEDIKRFVDSDISKQFDGMWISYHAFYLQVEYRKYLAMSGQQTIDMSVVYNIVKPSIVANIDKIVLGKPTAPIDEYEKNHYYCKKDNLSTSVAEQINDDDIEALIKNKTNELVIDL